MFERIPYILFIHFLHLHSYYIIWLDEFTAPTIEMSVTVRPHQRELLLTRATEAKFFSQRVWTLRSKAWQVIWKRQARQALASGFGGAEKCLHNYIYIYKSWRTALYILTANFDLVCWLSCTSYPVSLILNVIELFRFRICFLFLNEMKRGLLFQSIKITKFRSWNLNWASMRYINIIHLTTFKD